MMMMLMIFNLENALNIQRKAIHKNLPEVFFPGRMKIDWGWQGGKEGRRLEMDDDAVIDFR